MAAGSIRSRFNNAAQKWKAKRARDKEAVERIEFNMGYDTTKSRGISVGSKVRKAINNGYSGSVPERDAILLKKLLYGFIGALILGGISGGYIYGKKRKQNESQPVE